MAFTELLGGSLGRTERRGRRYTRQRWLDHIYAALAFQQCCGYKWLDIYLPDPDLVDINSIKKSTYSDWPVVMARHRLSLQPLMRRYVTTPGHAVPLGDTLNLESLTFRAGAFVSQSAICTTFPP